MCGGTPFLEKKSHCIRGLSPRVRGNPALASSLWCRYGVYPRVCGGTRCSTTSNTVPTGLSPRVRGNPDQRRQDLHRGRSIPACAGEPPHRRQARRVREVYPRVCGGTWNPPLSATPRRGLSPRVRGNPSLMRMLRNQAGSIPACAGEPERTAAHNSISEVYPRVCGGTIAVVRMWDLSSGLSPRVRGNPYAGSLLLFSFGSIPACAGEPSLSIYLLQRKRVYPRVCGGTHRRECGAASQQGLSPRVRGNHP